MLIKYDIINAEYYFGAQTHKKWLLVHALTCTCHRNNFKHTDANVTEKANDEKELIEGD